MAQLLIGEYFIVDVYQRERNVQVMFLKEAVECRFAQTVTLAGEAFYAVAVDGMVELAFWGHDEHLAGGGCCCVFHYQPLYTIRKSHQPMTFRIELVNQPTAAQSFYFFKGGSYHAFLADVFLAAAVVLTAIGFLAIGFLVAAVFFSAATFFTVVDLLSAAFFWAAAAAFRASASF